MRGLSVRRGGRLGYAFCVLVVFVVALGVVTAPAQAAFDVDWKDLVADIEAIRDEAIEAFAELSLEFIEFLSDGPTAAEGGEALTETHAEIEEIADDSIEDISEVMSEYRDVQQVQNRGSKAVGAVADAAADANAVATLHYNQYLAGLPATTISTSEATTTISTSEAGATTSTSEAGATTSTSEAGATTSTSEAGATTSTSEAGATTSTSEATSTTMSTSSTATVAGASSGTTTTTSVVATASVDDSKEARGEAGNRVGGATVVPSEGDALPTVLDISEPLLTDQRLTASLTRVLDPVLPPEVTEVLVSPLMVLELLWRALSSGGQLLMIPGILLVLYTLGMLWDRRRVNRRTLADA